MAKDINIHIKTPGSPEAKKQLEEILAQSKKLGATVEESGEKTKAASSKMMDSLKSLGGMLGFTGLAATAIGAIRKIIQALDEMARKSEEAVNKLAAQQKAAADLFEAFDAYSPQSRKQTLGMVSKFQETTGLGYDESRKLLETYKRQFGKVDQAGAEQFAGYYQLHGGESTLDLMKWMAASGVTDTKRQGSIMRMIEASADAAKLQGSDVIEGLTLNSEKARALGWTPEESVQNIAKVMSGLTGREAKRSVSGLVEGITSFDEKAALEMKAPAAIAGDDKARLEWARQQLMSSNNPAKLAREMFGGNSAYVMKFLTGQTSPETEKALAYAQTPQAAAEEQQRVLDVRQSTEGIMNRAEGTGGLLKATIKTKAELQAGQRQIEKDYLDWLQIHEPTKYEEIMISNIGSNAELYSAGRDLWKRNLTPDERVRHGLGKSDSSFLPSFLPMPGYDKMSEQDKFDTLQKGIHTIINDYSIHWELGNDFEPQRVNQRE